MNERLKELIKEAGISTAEYYRNLDDPKTFYSKSIVNEWSEDFKQQLNLEPYLRVKKMDESTLEKFAELLIKECANVARQTETDDSDDYKSGRAWASLDILEHFGV